MELKSINWIITDTCHSRCVHCDMWESAGRRPDLGLDEIGRILSDEVIRKSYEKYGKDFDISFAGGEPFVREDLQSIIDLVEKMYPGSFKCITTNGLLSERILRFVEKNRHLCFKLNISIDGLEKINDAMRGGGSFRKAVGLIRTIKQRFPSQDIEVKLTVSSHNYDQILKVYWLAVKLGCHFTFKPAENLQNFTNSRRPLEASLTPDQLCVVRNQCFKMADLMYRQGHYRKAKFYQDIPFYLAKKKMPTSCSVLNDHLTIMPTGECCFCVKEPSVGRIPQRLLSDISKPYDLDEFKCRSCMLVCGVYKDYTNAPFERTVANVEAMNRCNLRCSFCTQKGFDAYEPEVMDLDRFEKLLREYPAISHVSFIGGEPFLNKFFFEIMDCLDKRGIMYEITTNGTFINEQTIHRLKACIGLKNVLFSLDGLESCHDRERGRGTFNKCLRSLHLMKDLFAVGVCSVFKADNGEDIVKLSGLLAGMGIKDHRVIYGMSHSQEAVGRSSKAAPHLVFQGPAFDAQVHDYTETMNFFHSLEQTAQEQQTSIIYVPALLRTQTRSFLEGSLAQKGQAQCLQLEQMRFDASGKRIVCEFIRNHYDDKIVDSLRRRLLPLCEKCCKLRAV